MEIARGAKPGLPLEEMLRQGMLGFERSGARKRETSVYRCNEGTVVSVRPWPLTPKRRNDITFGGRGKPWSSGLETPSWIPST